MRLRWSTLVACCGAGIALSFGAMARADCPLNTPLANCTPLERAERLERALLNEADRARTWRYAWTGINGALAIGSFGLAAFIVDAEDRPDYIISGIGSSFTMAATFLAPLEVESNAREAVRLRSLPDNERVSRLSELTKASAKDARLRASWPFHVLNFAGCAAVGSLIAFGYDHPVNGIVTGVSGFAIGETQLFTQPQGPLEADQLSTSVRLVPWLQLTESSQVAGLSGTF